MIFEITSVQATYMACMSETKGDNYKQSSIPFLKERTNVWRKPFFGDFTHIKRFLKDVQIIDLIHLLVPLEVWDKAHRVLKLLNASSL